MLSWSACRRKPILVISSALRRQLAPSAYSQSAYVHIPFCSYKCDFCDFAAFAGLDHMASEYVDVVVGEIGQRLAKMRSLGINIGKLSSVFYGGGTPGLIDPALIGAIQDALAEQIGFASDCETTLETTPHSVTLDKAQAWLSYGVNRISIGVQSFIDEELETVGRDHKASQALHGLKTAQEAGFKNISCDLMFGLPKQTLASFATSLETALAQEINHLSCYGLTLATNSPLSLRYPQDSPIYPAEDSYVAMYEKLLELTAQAGFVRYEISNFAKPGFQSRHNQSCWARQEYFAFGVSAHRFIAGVRSSNWRSLARYMKDPLSDETAEKIDQKAAAQEAVFLGLRQKDGIDLNQFAQDYGFRLEDKFALPIRKFVDSGLLTCANQRLALSDKGVLLSNSVMAELI
jgi:oxygen-independent coproporphyrinogen-3 oxidase